MPGSREKDPRKAVDTGSYTALCYEKLHSVVLIELGYPDH